jgi:hypothetical protein
MGISTISMAIYIGRHQKLVLLGPLWM